MSAECLESVHFLPQPALVFVFGPAPSLWLPCLQPHIVLSSPLQATIELPGIKGVWSLRATSMDVHDKYLVLTFVGETRLLAINQV